jgi:hypothetical protein
VTINDGFDLVKTENNTVGELETNKSEMGLKEEYNAKAQFIH